MHTVQFEVSNFSVATQYQINYQFVITFYSCVAVELLYISLQMQFCKSQKTQKKIQIYLM